MYNGPNGHNLYYDPVFNLAGGVRVWVQIIEVVSGNVSGCTRSCTHVYTKLVNIVTKLDNGHMTFT